MTIDSIKTVAVLGSGTMGNGIAHVFARAGYSVILRDVEERFLERGMETIGKNLDREIKKGKLAEAEKRRSGADSARDGNGGDWGGGFCCGGGAGED